MKKNDIIISDIRCAEQNSQIVQNGAIDPGDFYKGQILANSDEVLDVLFLNTYNEYEVYKNNRFLISSCSLGPTFPLERIWKTFQRE